MASSYQVEQLENQNMVATCLNQLEPDEKKHLCASIADYLVFRRQVDSFLEEHFKSICTVRCFQDKLSACCSKDGIITFFADIVINALESDPEDMALLIERLEKPHQGYKCIYLGSRGCMWKVRPVVCQMFLCDSGEKEVFYNQPEIKQKWEELKELKKRFTWPDQPVLFDDIETFFIDRGCSSSLMYLHNSPGLLRVKDRALKKEMNQ